MPLTRLTTKVLAVALMFWCAGVGCMIVAYARCADNEIPVAGAAEPAADEMGGMPACHAHKLKTKRAAKSNSATADSVGHFSLPAPARSGAMSCCPLTTGAIATASRQQTDNSAPPLARPNSQLPDLIHSTPAPLAVPLRLPNRAHSYLLDCAFLI